MGERLYLLPNLFNQKGKLLHVTLVSCILTIVGAVFLIIVLKEWLLFSCIIFSVSVIIRIYTVKKLSENNGIYERGIILGMFIKYKQIKSYELLKEDKVKLFLMNGKILNITINEKLKEITKIFEINQISLINN